MTTVGGTAGRRGRRPQTGTGPWSLWFERALGLVFALSAATDVLMSLAYMGATLRATSPVGGLAMIAGTVALLVAGAVVATGHRSPWIAAVTVAVMLVTQALVVTHVADPAALPPVWWAWQLMVPAFVLIVGLLPLRVAAWTVPATAAAYLAIRTAPAAGGWPAWPAAVSEVTMGLVFVALSMIFIPAWRGTAAIADEAADAHRLAFAAAEATRAVDRQQQIASRLLHDEVIHTLRAVALPPGAIEVHRVHAMAENAAALLDDADRRRPAGPRDLPAGLSAIAERSATAVTLHVTGTGRLPDTVVEAVIGAAAEAVRNAERHAGCETVEITAALTPDGVRVRVADRGRGFDPSTIPPGPLGFRRSIVERMAEVGGTAEVRSAPGRGTCINLSWQIPPAQGLASHRLADLAGTRNRIVLGATVPLLAFMAVQAALHHRLLTEPRPALVTVGLMIVLTLAAGVRATRRPMGPVESAALIGAAVVAPLIGGIGLVAGGDIAVAYFAAGIGAPALSLVAMFRPTWESIAGAVGATAATATVVWRLGPDGVLLLPALPAVLANAFAVACLLGGRLTIDRTAGAIRRSEELQRHAYAAAIRSQVARDVLSERLGRVREWVLPFLTAVGDGAIALGTEATRREASALEAAVRDDIRLGPQIDATTRALIATTRRAGRRVEIIADSDLPPQLPDGLVRRLLGAALADLRHSPDRTVLTVSGTRVHQVGLMVSPPPEKPDLVELARELAGRILRGPDFLLIRLDAVSAEPVMSPELGTWRPEPVRIG